MGFFVCREFLSGFFCGAEIFGGREFLAVGNFWGFLGFLAVRDFWGFCRFGAFEVVIDVEPSMLRHRCCNIYF